MANETTIRANVKVSGLSELEKANSLIKEIGQSLSSMGKGSSSTSLSGLSSSLSKARSEAKELASTIKQIDSINLNKVGTSATEGLSKAEAKANELKSKLEQATKVNGSAIGTKFSEGMSNADRSVDRLRSSVKESISAEKELASAAKAVAEAESKSASAAEKGATARKRAAQEERQARQTAISEASSPKKEGKITGAIRDVAGMYTLGNLAANGIMAGGEAIKGLIGSGLSYISNQQASEVSWASNARSVSQLLGRSMSNAQATAFSKGMVRDIQNLATQAGNDYGQVSDAALAFYATGGGVSTAGNKKKTLQLTKDMLNLQDAGGMNDEEMGRFIQSVAKTLDQDKLTTERLNQLKAFNPNIDEYLSRAHKQRTGKNAKKTGEYTGDDLVNALHMAGMAPGVSDASKKMNESLQGTQRAVKNGMVRMTAGFEEQLGKSLNKAFGGDGKLFSRITDWFNDPKKTASFSQNVANGTAGVISTAGHVGKEAMNVAKDLSDVVKPIAGGFGTGFIDQVRTFKRGLSDAYSGVKSTISNITGMLPKGAKSNIENFGRSFGQMAGRSSAYLLAMRGLTKVPGLGGLTTKAIQPLLQLTDKIPIVGKTLSGLLSKITGVNKVKDIKTDAAANKMQSAANTMMSAANRINGSSRGSELSARGNAGSSATRQIIEDTVATTAGELGTGGLTRMQLYGGNKLSAYERARTNPNAWFNKLSARGQQLWGAAGSRQRANAGLINRIRGSVLTGLGTAGEKIFGESRVGNAIYRGTLATGRGIRAAGRFINRGAPGMNAMFAGLDVASALGTTRSGSLARHKAIGSAVGSGVGSTLGMAAGTLLDPFTFGMGTVAGGMLGGWLGGKAGSWIGSKFGGSKSSGRRPSISWGQRQQSTAEKAFAKQQFVSGYNDMYSSAGVRPGASASSAYRTYQAAQKGNSKARLASMNYEQSMQNGDIRGAEKYRKQMASAVKSEDAKDIQKAQRDVAKTSKAQAKAFKEAYKAQKASLDAQNNGLSEKQKRQLAKSRAADDKDYRKAKSAASKARGKLKSKRKKYRDETGEDYHGSSKRSSRRSKSHRSNRHSSRGSRGRSKKTSVRAKTKGTKGVEKLSKATKGVKNKNAKVKAKVSGSKKAKSLGKSLKKIPKSKKSKVKAKVSGDKKAKKLSKSLKKIPKKKNSKVKAKVSGDKKAKKLSKALKKIPKSKKAKVKAKVSGSSKVKKLAKDIKKVKNKNAKVKAKTSGSGKVKSLSKDIKKVKNKNARVKASTSGSGKVKSLSKDIKSVKNKNARVNARVSGAGSVRNLKKDINGVKSKSVNVTAKVTGTGEVKGLTKAINAVKSKSVNVTAKVNGTSAVQALVSAINAVHSKSVTITANVHKNGHLATGTPGAVATFGRLATGTPRFALANGTPAATTNQWSANGGVKKGTYLVNDAPGSDFVEAFMTKAGTIGLFPKQRNLLVPLEEGTQVLNAKDTKRKFPRLEKGTLNFGGNTTNNQKKTNTESKVVHNQNTFNINVNIDGSGGVDQKTIQQIANTIAEKLTIAFPESEV